MADVCRLGHDVTFAEAPFNVPSRSIRAVPGIQVAVFWTMFRTREEHSPREAVVASCPSAGRLQIMQAAEGGTSDNCSLSVVVISNVLHCWLFGK